MAPRNSKGVNIACFAHGTKGGHTSYTTLGYFIKHLEFCSNTYDHRLERTGHPVRSAIHKLEIGRLVVGWVTTSEYLLLYVFDFHFVS
jgi:hypothetical protein